MEERYLIDTSAVIKYLNNTLPATGLSFMDKIVDEKCLLSFISEVELQVWNPADPQDLLIYQQFVSGSFVFGLDDNIIQETIRKHDKIKLPDAFVAATAITHGLTLIADNDKDFLNIAALKYVNPNKL
jgi:predicted nucleic acid-binding protein